MDTPYSNREIDAHFNEVKDLLKDIKVQTTKTNGRVTKLENWRGVTVGALVIISVIVIPLITYSYIRDLQSIRDEIRQLTR